VCIPIKIHVYIEGESYFLFIYIYVYILSIRNDSIIMILTTNDNKKISFWNIFPSDPLYIIIPNIFLIRPIRFLFNYYIKPAKFLVIILPRNIWQKGNI
jgi:hypothetical protein